MWRPILWSRSCVYRPQTHLRYLLRKFSLDTFNPQTLHSNPDHVPDVPGASLLTRLDLMQFQWKVIVCYLVKKMICMIFFVSVWLFICVYSNTLGFHPNFDKYHNYEIIFWTKLFQIDDIRFVASCIYNMHDDWLVGSLFVLTHTVLFSVWLWGSSSSLWTLRLSTHSHRL